MVNSLIMSIFTILKQTTLLTIKRQRAMKATIELTKRTDLEEVINSNDIDAIKSLIERKEISLKEAEENAAFYESICNEDFASNERQRANRLIRDIEKLKLAI